MPPTWIASPRQKPSISLPGGRRLMTWTSGASLEAARQALGQAGGEDLLSRGAKVVRNAKERQPRPLEVGHGVTRGVVVVARLARRAHDGEPLAVLCGGDGCPGNRAELEQAPIGAGIEQLLLMDVAAEDEARRCGAHALL